MLKPHPYNVTYIENPDQEELRRLTLEHVPAVQETSYGNLLKHTRNKERKAAWTYILAPESEKSRWSGKLLDREKAEPLLARQREYIEKHGTLIQVDGYLGLGERAVPVQYLYTQEGANIAGMQQVLCFPRSMVEGDGALGEFRPALRVVYTPECYAEGMPGKQAILVDLENWTTHVMGPDYFGESKKGALRMLNEYVYNRGGLVLHAGAKSVTVEGKTITMAILGLSGTGKTTTTFSKQGEVTRPIQDDMMGLWEGGECSITENGCFAKTFDLTMETEPAIFEGTVHADAWVENVYLNDDGSFDFSKQLLTPEEVKARRDILLAAGAPRDNVDAYITGKKTAKDVIDALGTPADGWDFTVWTQNGRSIIPMSAIKNAADFTHIPPVRSIGILNRDEGADAATPGIVRFTSPDQAAAYLMLGETSKTSAAGKERGKTRSPFTQPFFPRAHGKQAERFSALAATMPGTAMWMMNTGYIGGDARAEKAGKALKVKIRHSSTMLEAMLSGNVVWKRDPDFDYEIVDVDHPDNADLIERVPREILNPALFFDAAGRRSEYDDWVRRMKAERKAFLESFGVAPGIVGAVAGNCC